MKAKIPASPNEIKSVLGRYGISARKAWGQNFLVNQGVLDKIVDAGQISQQDTVLEVGPGLGCLTQRLAELAGRVVCLEIDPHLCEYLREQFDRHSNVEIVQTDVLKADLKSLVGGSYKLMANLPYYITSPFLAGLLEKGPQPDLAVVLVQWEVAQRLVALPGTKDYGALSVLIQYNTRPEIICKVPPGNFYPPPKVSSAVVRMVSLADPPVIVQDVDLMFDVVRVAFGQRRKMLKGLLARHYSISPAQVEKIMLEARLPVDVRGERLSVQDFARLSDKIREAVR